MNYVAIGGTIVGAVIGYKAGYIKGAIETALTLKEAITKDETPKDESLYGLSYEEAAGVVRSFNATMYEEDKVTLANYHMMVGKDARYSDHMRGWTAPKYAQMTSDGKHWNVVVPEVEVFEK